MAKEFAEMESVDYSHPRRDLFERFEDCMADYLKIPVEKRSDPDRIDLAHLLLGELNGITSYEECLVRIAQVFKGIEGQYIFTKGQVGIAVEELESTGNRLNRYRLELSRK